MATANRPPKRVPGRRGGRLKRNGRLVLSPISKLKLQSHRNLARTQI